jgi:hypothetical protein
LAQRDHRPEVGRFASLIRVVKPWTWITLSAGE